MSSFNLEEIEAQVDKIERVLDARENALSNIEASAGVAVATAWPVSRVRSTFINYFVERRNHVFWQSSPVVPVNDPTLLFANSGMNQYKPLFLGTCDPSLEMSKLKRAVNSQKCIRAGGKHNDLEDVGKDVYHHTFFEMLGNWSFGCYFKEQAIPWAWECLTEVYGLDPTRLYATYFGGDEKQGLAPDDEARTIWLNFLPADRVLPFGCKDNFWEMGATGPCGPCTEIHYDRLGGRDAAALVNADRPDVIEIWNNVFIQFNREADGSLKELPNKHVDTGMGLERLSSILQGKDSNYDTDIFMPIFDTIQRLCGCRPYTGLVGAADTDLIDMAYRVVADHIRTLTFAITDGAMPSSDGRGYVLRRILRRAVRYGQEILGAPAGFFTAITPTVVSNFSDAFPELTSRQDFVMRVIADEEQSFGRTLDQGVRHFKKVVSTIQATDATVIPAKEAHFLFTSMGFPLDLTELMAAERGFTVDSEGFAALMEADRQISEAAELARKGGGLKDLSMEAEQTAWLSNNGIHVTDNSRKYETAVGFDARVVAVFQGRGGSTAGFTDCGSVNDGRFGLVLDASPFYYESGGQVFDTGTIQFADGSVFTVDNCQSYAGYVVHVGQLSSGSELSVGAACVAQVDYARRALIAPNHTMTHVLNFALRSVLLGGVVEAGSNQCEQKGSLVDSEKLRFDFSWTGPLTNQQIAEVERIVVGKILQGLPVFAEVVPLAAAADITALRKVFGERYPDPVRVISVGADVQTLLADPSNSQWAGLSVEFCGGTHLSNTAQAEAFVIYEESGIAKGVRRIAALTRGAAVAARERAAALLDRLSAMEGMPAGPELVALTKAIKLEIDRAVVSLVDKECMRTKLTVIGDAIKKWSKLISASRTSSTIAAAEALAREALASNQTLVVSAMDFGADGKLAKKIQEKFVQLHPTADIVIASLDDEAERIGLFVFLTPPTAARVSAKAVCDHCIEALGGGKGGGKADQANASIPVGEVSGDRLAAAVDAARSYLASRL